MKKLPDDPQERMRVLQERYYETMSSAFRGGTYDNVFAGIFSGINKQIRETKNALIFLNDAIRKADESSTKLTKALNRITLTGIVIAGVSFLVAAASVGLEYWKYFHPIS